MTTDITKHAEAILRAAGGNKFAHYPRDRQDMIFAACAACKKEICGHPDPVYSGAIPPRDTEQPEHEERENLLDPVIEIYPNKATLWL